MRTSYLYSALVFCLLLVGCSKKSDDPTPAPVDLSAKIAGTYAVSRLTMNGQTVTLPQQGVSVGVKFEKVGSAIDRSNMTITTNIQGTIDASTDEVDLKANGSDVELYKSAIKVGTWSNNNLTIDVISDDGQRVIIVAKR